MQELFAMAVWAAFGARTSCLAFWGQATKLAPVMKKLRHGFVPATLAMVLFAPFSQAHSMPGDWVSGSLEPAKKAPALMVFDGISLDQAVNRAERQYRARVVRTDVQDEDGRTVYVLKMLSEDGRVFTVRIDAATGRMR
jgi:hypothetical protein